jgi:hypothetical protein
MPQRVAEQHVQDLPQRRGGGREAGQVGFDDPVQAAASRVQGPLPPVADLGEQVARVDGHEREARLPDQADEVLDDVRQVLAAGQGILQRRSEVGVWTRRR